MTGKDKSRKPKATRADEPLHAEEAKPDVPDVTEFEIRKGLNPYGFIHIPKRVRGSLPFEQGVPLKAKIEGNALVIRAQ